MHILFCDSMKTSQYRIKKRFYAAKMGRRSTSLFINGIADFRNSRAKIVQKHLRELVWVVDRWRRRDFHLPHQATSQAEQLLTCLDHCYLGTVKLGHGLSHKLGDMCVCGGGGMIPIEFCAKRTSCLAMELSVSALFEHVADNCSCCVVSCKRHVSCLAIASIWPA